MKKNTQNSPTMLIILDGFGYRPHKKGNAIAHAKMPTWKNVLLKKYPNSLLKTSGTAVGLLKGFAGNSEVGHTCLGCGRIVKTSLKKFHESIEDKSIFKNKILIKNFKKLQTSHNSLHLMGLLSNGGVHSHEKHLYALLRLARIFKLKKVFIHPFLDGRDTPAKSAAKYLQKLQKICNELTCGKIGTIHGRFYAMDRDNNWDRTKISYDILCKSKLNKSAKFSTWQEALKKSYSKNITDEFFYPIRLHEEGRIKKNDGIVFFNFRSDRARQLTECFINPKFKHFKTENLNSTSKTLKFFISTTRYKKEFKKFNNEILFEKEEIKNTLLDEIAKQKSNNNKVFIIAETEKYAHVTYFFRGLTEKQLPNEIRTLVPSIKTKSYVKNPEMSAEKITKKLLGSLNSKPAYFYLVNYANPDMVGHSGNLKATIKACEFLDKQLKKLYEKVVMQMNGTMFILSDHGNAEEMIDIKTNTPITSHTKNPVPFVLASKKQENKPLKLKKNLGLANVAPTILKFLGLKIPKEMTQSTLF